MRAGVCDMNGQASRRSIHWIAALVLGLTVLLSATPALAATPTQPVIKDTWVSGVAKVSLRWEPSRDASGHAVGYDIYRDVIPVTAATITSRSLTPVVTNYAGTTIEINASAAEVAQSYVWFYAIVARDDQVPANYSAPSKNMQANLHGWRPASESEYTISCLRCHSVHGAYQIDYHTEELCYMCHGGTSASSAVGAKSSLNTQRYFYDYDGQTAGSKHRNQWMTDNDRECAACHTPHRTPYFYDAAGVYQASQSYRKMLRAQTSASPAYAYFGVNSDTAENTAFCFACHGTSSTQMALGGGSAAYGATGGDHNSAGYATAAHGTDFLKSNDVDTSFPQVQCLACHDNHAAAADKLIDYRKSRTTNASQWAGANLCFACHSGLTSESKYVAANTSPPFSWNGRDVRAQFVSKTSKHPYAISSSEPVSGTVTHTTQGDFGAYAHTDTVADGTVGDGALRLADAVSSATIFSDGFESNNFSAWTSNSNWTTSTTQRRGSYSARQNATSTDCILTRNVTTTGYTNLTLTFWLYGNINTENTDYITVETYSGGTWTERYRYTLEGQVASWAQHTVTLPDGITSFRIIGRVSSTSEYQYLDDVQLTGQTGSGYLTSGSARSTTVAPSGLTAWERISGSDTKPAGTTLVYDVLDASDDSVLLADRTLPIDISGLSATGLTVRSKLTGNGSVTPYVNDLSFEFAHVVTGVGSLTCVNCHNVHSVKAEKSSGAWDMDRVSDPNNTKNPAPTTTAYGSTTADFCMRCHDGTVPSATITTSTLVPYQPAFSARTEPYFPGWNKAESGFSFASSGHMAAAAADGRALCETCHDPHASDNLRLTAWTLPSGVTWANGNSIAGVRANTVAAAGEQNLCYKCHGDGSASYPRANGAKNVYTKAKLANAHDPDDYTGQHRDTEAASAQAGDAATRHAECTDCHDPHVAARSGGSATHTLYSSVSGPAIWGAYGAKPTYATSNWGGISSFSAERLTGASTSFEAYLCFKCHSSNVGTIPTGQTDIATEFNPSNFSYHNVLGQSVGMKTAFSFTDSSGTTQNRTWSLPSASSFLKSEWVNNGGVNAKMTCTDCHDGYRDTGTPDPTTMARGPHGSSVDWLLDPDYSNWTSTTSLTNYSGVICGKCHTNLANSNVVHQEHDSRGNEGGYCRFCHIKVPHGWKRPRMLGYTTDGPYATISGGITKIRANKDYTPNNWSKGSGGDCSAGCDNAHPSTLSNATYWP